MVKSARPDRSLSGLIQSVRNQATPWREKIKTAHKLLSNEYYLPNKHQIILDWACQELINNSTKEIYPNEMLKELWEIITEILKVSGSLKEKCRILSLRTAFIEVLTKEFQSTSVASIAITDCCKLIFSKVDIYKPLVVKFEKYVNFLANVLRCLPLLFDGMAEKFDNDAEDVKRRVNSYLDLADTLLQLYLKLQKQQPSARKISIGFNEKLFKELVVWRMFLSKCEKVASDYNKVADFETVVQETLWHKENLEAIKGHLHLLTEGSSMASTEEQKSRKFALLDSCFTAIERCMEMEDDGRTKSFTHDSMLYCIPKVYQTFLKANRETKTLPTHFEFFLFRKLSTVAVAGIDASKNEDENVNILLKCIVALLKLLVEFNVFKINDDVINCEVNKEHLNNIARKVMTLLGFCASKNMDYHIELIHCIRYLMEIDRSLVLEYLPVVVQELLLRRKSRIQQEKERRVDNEKDNLLCFLLDMHAKSRQTEKFLELLTSSLIKTDADKGDITINRIFLQRLEEIAKLLPVGQMLSIIEMLMNEISSHSLKDLHGSSSKKGDKFTLAGKTWQGAGNILKLNILSEIFSIFALNIHVLSSNGYIGENQERFLNLARRMHKDIVQPITEECLVVNTTAEYLRTAWLELAWKFINTLQRISLFLLHHGMISSPLQQFVYCNGVILPSSSWERISLPDVLSEEYQCLQTNGVILQMRQMIVMSKDKALQDCCSQLNSLVAKVVQFSKTEGDIAIKARIVEILLKNLPWLAEHLSNDAVEGLCEVTFALILGGEKVSMQAERQQGSESSSSSRFGALLYSPLFYDNHRIQTIFCKVVAVKIRTLLNNKSKGNIMPAFDKILNMKNIEPETILREPRVDDHDVMMNDENEAENVEMKDDKVSGIANNCVAEQQANEIDELDPSLSRELTMKNLCNEMLLALLVKVDYGAFGNAASGSDCDMDGYSSSTVLGGIEKVLHMMKFEWLLPENAVKLLLAIMLFQSEEKDFNFDIFSFLAKVTSMTIAASHTACWKIMDPALLLRLIMCHLQTYASQGLDMPANAFECVHNLWTLVLSVKKQKVDSEAMDLLKSKMIQLANKVIHHPDVLSIELMNELLLVILEVLQSRVIKKHALSMAIAFAYPIAEKLLSTDPADIIRTKTNETGNRRTALISLKSYGYCFAICILMKKSGKNQQFMSLIEKSNLQSRITSVAEVVKARLNTCSKTIIDDELSRYEEEIYLEFLDLIGQFGSVEDITHWQEPEFCQSVFSDLLSLVFRTNQDPNKERRYPLYYKVMSQFINESEESTGRTLLEEFIQNMVSNLEKFHAVVTSLGFLEYLLTMKRSKDNRQVFKAHLPKLMNLCVEVISTASIETDEKSVLLAFKVIVEILGFSKGILSPPNAVATLHSIFILCPKITGVISFEIFQSKVNLLSVLLFNYPNAVYGAIASFISAVRNLLSEFASLEKYCSDLQKVQTDIQDKTVAEKLMKACEKLTRLYQEIASHKQVISKYATYIMADYLNFLAHNVIPERLQVCLTSGIYCIMDTCTRREFAQLNMVLAQAERELFKELHNSYNKHHKFKGKA